MPADLVLSVHTSVDDANMRAHDGDASVLLMGTELSFITAAAS